MFSCSFGRAVRSVPASTITARAPSASSITAIRPLSRSTQQRQPVHQRRLSSSKTSIPPDGSKQVAPSQRATSSGRTSRRKSKDTTTPLDTQNQPFSKQFPYLPSVPSTQHLHPADVNISSFFSLHRPISVTTAIPPETTEAQFNSLFEPRSVNNRKKFDEVIFTLGNFTENLEGDPEHDEDGGLHWQIAQESSSNGEIRHLDGAPRDIPLDKIIAQFRPFRAPPPPQPFTEPSSVLSKPKQKGTRLASAKKTRNSWSTTITVTEYTNPDGEKMYAAASTPIVRLPAAFRERMRIRQQNYRDSLDERSQRAPWQKPEMRLISVKRQRKLKMKKHKYKKLMKRTRNERRKLGKL